jgi:hypothetical protein
MRRLQEPLTDKLQTARRIKHLVETFYLDLDRIYLVISGKKTRLSWLSLQEYFNLVKNIPYRRDPKPIEIVTRPYYIFKYSKLGMDCKKKGAAIAAYLRYKNYKYRAIGTSQRPDKRIHHIFFQFFDPKKAEWITADATYKTGKIGEKKHFTKWEVLR